MPVITLQEALSEATSLLDLARRVGAVCLEEEGLLADLQRDQRVKRHVKYVEARIEQISRESWERYSTEGFGTLLDEADLSAIVRYMRTQSPAEFLGFLRGLCKSELARFYLTTTGRVTLDYGLPLVSATRPINLIYARSTPYDLTLGAASILEELPYELFRHRASAAVRVVLDFAQRKRLDYLTWTKKGRLPRVATIHPTLNDGDLDLPAPGEPLFDVHPKQCSKDDLLGHLQKAKNQEIAVLSELALREPEALEDALAAEPDSYPRLIVAGSAHARRREGGNEIRVNESRVYLDGVCVSTHRKIHPFKEKDGSRTVTEAITLGSKEITILSGRHTRMAVVICADLNDSVIPTLLIDAGVNLLLAPARTFSDGAFHGVAADLASRCQAVCVVVNARLDSPQKSEATKAPAPFMVLAAVPRPAQDGQTHFYRRQREAGKSRTISRGVLNPNVPLGRAMKWK